MEAIYSVSKIEQVRQAILQLIFSGTLRPGQRLLEARLAKDFSVSQATINAALQDLHNQGIVTKILNRSTNVSRYTHVEIDNLFSTRMVLEPAATGAAARKLTDEGMRRLREQVDNMRRAGRANNLSRFCLADYTFHQQVYRMSQNPFLIQACQAIAAAPFAYILCDCNSALPTDYLSLAEDHQDIIRSMEEGPEAAERAARERIDAWRMHSVRALEAIERLAARGA